VRILEIKDIFVCVCRLKES